MFEGCQVSNLMRWFWGLNFQIWTVFRSEQSFSHFSNHKGCQTGINKFAIPSLISTFGQLPPRCWRRSVAAGGWLRTAALRLVSDDCCSRSSGGGQAKGNKRETGCWPMPPAPSSPPAHLSQQSMLLLKLTRPSQASPRWLDACQTDLSQIKSAPWIDRLGSLSHLVLPILHTSNALKCLGTLEEKRITSLTLDPCQWGPPLGWKEAHFLWKFLSS